MAIRLAATLYSPDAANSSAPSPRTATVTPHQIALVRRWIEWVRARAGDALAVEARRVLAAQVDQMKVPFLLPNHGMAPADDPAGVQQRQVARRGAPDQDLLLFKEEFIAVTRGIQVSNMKRAGKGGHG